MVVIRLYYLDYMVIIRSYSDIQIIWCGIPSYNIIYIIWWYPTDCIENWLCLRIKGKLIFEDDKVIYKIKIYNSAYFPVIISALITCF
ncbi:hypothetical protein C1646_778160 [Rhizophagus diaphanus]|nr:hypothetical protein C1646_778160 [Rhizophagus diaphanus] [Rhizophagus sp. MUCL 43196]